MADPFGEFEQVAEKKTEAPDGLLQPGDVEKQVGDGSHLGVPWEQIKSKMHPDFTPQGDEHYKQRHKYFAKAEAKQREIFDVMDELYTVRHDVSRDLQESVGEIKELLAKLNLLNEELAQLTEGAMNKFSDSLGLDELGIARRIRTRSFRKPSRVDFEDGSSDAGLARTRSTATLQGKPAQEKWQGLFRMFREWKFQKQISEAQNILDKTENERGAKGTVGEAKVIAEEKTKIRAAIYQLRQRRGLNESEKTLLRILQGKLRALNQLAAE